VFPNCQFCSSFLFGAVVKLAVFDTFLENFLVSYLKLFLSKRFGLVYLENFAEKNQKSAKRSIKEVGRK